MNKYKKYPLSVSGRGYLLTLRILQRGSLL